MAEQTKQGFLYGGAEQVFPHTSFNEVHDPNNWNHTVNEMNEDLNRAFRNVTQKKGTAYVSFEFTRVDGTTQTTQMSPVSKTYAGILSVKQFNTIVSSLGKSIGQTSISLIVGGLSGDELGRIVLDAANANQAGLMSASDKNLLSDVINRMQGKSLSYLSHCDPIYYLGRYGGADAITRMNQDIDKFCPEDPNAKIPTCLDDAIVERQCPIGLVNICVIGQHLMLLNTPISFGRREYVQIAFGAVSSNGTAITGIGQGIITRKSNNGVWGNWQAFGLELATNTANGLMSASDKVKLNNSIKADDVLLEKYDDGLNLMFASQGGQTHEVEIPSATDTEAGVMTAEDRILLTDFKIRTFSIEVQCGSVSGGSVGTIGTFHLKRGEKIKLIYNSSTTVSGTIDCSDGSTMSWYDGMSEAVRDDHYGTFTIKANSFIGRCEISIVQ